MNKNIRVILYSLALLIGSYTVLQAGSRKTYDGPIIPLNDRKVLLKNNHNGFSLYDYKTNKWTLPFVDAKIDAKSLHFPTFHLNQSTGHLFGVVNQNDGANVFLISSTNGGSSWQSSDNGLPNPLFNMALALSGDGSNPERLLFGGAYEFLPFSNDDGAQWNVDSTYRFYSQMEAIRFSQWDKRVVLLGTLYVADSDYAEHQGIFRSDDGGITFTKTYPESNDSHRFSVASISEDPHREGRWFLALNRQIKPPMVRAECLLVSEDDGRSWRNVTPPYKGINSITQVDIDPLVPDRVWALNPIFGVLVSQDGGETWTQQNKGLGLLRRFHVLGWDTDYTQLLLTDTGALFKWKSGVWHEEKRSPLNPYWFLNLQSSKGQLFFTNREEQFSFYPDHGEKPGCWGNDPVNLGARTYAVSHENSAIRAVVAGGEYLYSGWNKLNVTRNGGETWESWGGSEWCVDPETSDLEFIDEDTLLSCTVRHDGFTFQLFWRNGSTIRKADSGPNRINDISIEGDRWLIAGNDGVWYSDDHGTTWDKSAGITDKTFSVTIGNPDSKYAAAVNGESVYLSKNRGESFQSLPLPPGQHFFALALSDGWIFTASQATREVWGYHIGSKRWTSFKDGWDQCVVPGAVVVNGNTLFVTGLSPELGISGLYEIPFPAKPSQETAWSRVSLGPFFHIASIDSVHQTVRLEFDSGGEESVLVFLKDLEADRMLFEQPVPGNRDNVVLPLPVDATPGRLYEAGIRIGEVGASRIIRYP